MGSPKDFKGGSLSPSLNPSSTMPSEVIPTQLSASDRAPIARPGAGIEGRQILLHSNQFTAKIKSHNVVFYQYNVRMCKSYFFTILQDTSSSNTFFLTSTCFEIT